MNFSAGLDSETARRAADSAAAHLRTDPRVRLVVHFGSSADPERSFVRDVDLAVLFDVSLPLDQLLKLRADLIGLVGVPIDLITLNEAGIVLAHEIAETGRCLYAADDSVEVDFITQACSRYWDFKPYLEQQWKLIGQRMEERRHGSAH